MLYARNYYNIFTYVDSLIFIIPQLGYYFYFTGEETKAQGLGELSWGHTAGQTQPGFKLGSLAPDPCH